MHEARAEGNRVICPGCPEFTTPTPGQAQAAARVHRLSRHPRHRAANPMENA